MQFKKIWQMTQEHLCKIASVGVVALGAAVTCQTSFKTPSFKVTEQNGVINMHFADCSSPQAVMALFNHHTGGAQPLSPTEQMFMRSSSCGDKSSVREIDFMRQRQLRQKIEL